MKVLKQLRLLLTTAVRMDPEDEKRLARAARSIRREFPLLRAHVLKLPFILGNLKWFQTDRYRFGRPKSELSPALYLWDHIVIVVKSLYTLPFTAVILAAMLVSLYLYELHTAIPFFFPYLLCLPFKTCLDFLSWYLGDPKFSMKRNVAAGMRHDYPNESWYLVNGIVESPAMCIATAEILHEWTGRAITPLVNPSHGFGVDILECILGRTLDVRDAVAKGILDEIERELSAEKKVVVIAHSQAGIILSQVVKELVLACKDDSTRASRLQQLEVYTFGSAADDFAGWKHPATGKVVPFAEHFAAEDDIVSRIGVLTYSGKLPLPKNAKGSYRDPSWNGEVHMLPRHLPCNGHLMKEHLLPALHIPLFGSESFFMTQYCNNRPSQDPKRMADLRM